MNIYDKALLDDPRNYIAMHYEYNIIFGVAPTWDAYLGFEAPLVPTFSLAKMILPTGSRVKITNLDVVSLGKSTFVSNTQAFNYILPPKVVIPLAHILAYSKKVKAARLYTQVELDAFYWGSDQVKVQVNPMIDQERKIKLTYEIDFGAIRIALVPKRGNQKLITRNYRYFDETDNKWKGKLLCDLPQMVKNGYFTYNYNTLSSNKKLYYLPPIMRIVYNAKTKKYWYHETAYFKKSAELIRPFFNIYTTNKARTRLTSVNLLYEKPDKASVSSVNPIVDLSSPFYDKLKAITYLLKDKNDIMTFRTFNRPPQLFTFLTVHVQFQNIERLNTNMTNRNRALLMAKQLSNNVTITKPPTQTHATKYSNNIFYYFNLSNTTLTNFTAYSSIFHQVSDFKTGNGKLLYANHYGLVDIKQEGLEVPGINKKSNTTRREGNTSLLLPGFVFYKSSTTAKTTNKKEHGVFGSRDLNGNEGEPL